MLEELSLRNIGGLDSAHLHFKGRFIAITGESGAGKSSIVRALEFASGKRAQSELIRAGEEEAEVIALFFCPRTLRLPEEISSEEGNLFLKRVFTRNGRGKTFIQGKLFPLSLFNEVAAPLLRIQSQFAQLELLDSDRQRDILDSYGGEEIICLKNELRSVFSNALLKEKELRSIEKKQKEVIDRYENANSILQSFKSISPEPNSEAIWEGRLERISKSIDEHTKLEQILAWLTGGKTGEGITDSIENLCLELTQIISPDTEKGSKYQELGNSALVFLQKLSQSLTVLLSEQSLSDLYAEQEEIENKLGTLRKLKRLAGARTLEELTNYCKEAEMNLTWLNESYRRSEQSGAEAKKLRREASRLALELRKKRERTARSLEEAVNHSLRDMAMEDITFSITLSDLGKIKSTGADEISFLMASGMMPPGPVMKIASGGELSRLLLALQLALPDSQLPGTLVFDEVEAGLGGKAAVLAGYKLRELAEKCRVILITHEATIAALAEQHFVVARQENKSFIKEIEKDERVLEIARMLSGNTTLLEAQEHAGKLLSQ
ncbi:MULTISPECIES: DNA repair protein RecN [Aminobacterium]|uniref:DNA repair protein RecN n=1 Tax=Aminobacterium TaxID=81466 RepID=UPI00257A9B2A|nr:AAA family ATPase [Aminobacterium sp. UBA4987]